MARNDLIGIKDLIELQPEDIDQIAKTQAKLYVGDNPDKGLKENQIRNFYSSILMIKNKVKNKRLFLDLNKQKREQFMLPQDIITDLVLLKPKLAYAAGRQPKVRNLYELISTAVDSITSSKDQVKSLSIFLSLVEALVAYHKFHKGK